MHCDNNQIGPLKRARKNRLVLIYNSYGGFTVFGRIRGGEFYGVIQSEDRVHYASPNKESLARQCNECVSKFDYKIVRDQSEIRTVFKKFQIEKLGTFFNLCIRSDTVPIL
jgi:hypothetical protein